MFGSSRSRNPDKPQGGKHDPPPNPDDRYAPTNCVRLFMYDVEGKPVVVVLSRRAAQALADELFRELATAGGKAGVS